MPLVAGIAFLVLILDQFTKWLAGVYLKPVGSFPIIPQVFHLSYVENSGIAFGFFRYHPEILTLLITASMVVLIFCTPYFTQKYFWKKAAYGAILGGALGNLVDRYR